MIDRKKDYDYICSYHFQVIMSHDRSSRIRIVIDNLYCNWLEPFRFGASSWVKSGGILGLVTLRSVFHGGLPATESGVQACRMRSAKTNKGLPRENLLLERRFIYCLKALTLKTHFLGLKPDSADFSCVALGYLTFVWLSFFRCKMAMRITWLRRVIVKIKCRIPRTAEEME